MKKIKLILQSTVMVLSGVTSMAGAEDIVVSGEAGVVWEGLPWSASGFRDVKFDVYSDGSYYISRTDALVAISRNAYGSGAGDCELNNYFNAFTTINGVTGLRLTEHMILIPVGGGATTYKDYYGKTQVANWRTDTNGFYWNMPHDNNKEYASPKQNLMWCATAYAKNSSTLNNTTDKVFYIPSRISYSSQGHWVIYADGKQTNAKSSIPPMYILTMGRGTFNQILPSNFNVRVTRLKCTVNTPQSIDFGTVANSSKTPRTIAGEVSVACAQGSVPESLEVSLLARPVGGSVLPTDTTVGVQIGGETVGTVRGFIGERANEEAGCIDRPSSLSLNYLNQYKLGGITQSESAKNFTQPLVWTFCPVPNSKTGRATAAIELNATFK